MVQSKSRNFGGKSKRTYAGRTAHTGGLAKTQGIRDVSTKRKRETKKKQEKEEQNKREKAKERQKRFREKKRKNITAKANQEQSQDVTDDATVFPSRMSKKRAKKKVSAALPKSPRKKAAIVKEMANSPNTRKMLQAKGIMKSSEEQQEITYCVL